MKQEEVIRITSIGWCSFIGCHKAAGDRVVSLLQTESVTVYLSKMKALWMIPLLLVLAIETAILEDKGKDYVSTHAH